MVTRITKANRYDLRPSSLGEKRFSDGRVVVPADSLHPVGEEQHDLGYARSCSRTHKHGLALLDPSRYEGATTNRRRIVYCRQDGGQGWCETLVCDDSSVKFDKPNL